MSTINAKCDSHVAHVLSRHEPMREHLKARVNTNTREKISLIFLMWDVITQHCYFTNDVNAVNSQSSTLFIVDFCSNRNCSIFSFSFSFSLDGYVVVAVDVCPRVLQTAQLFFPNMNAIKMVSAKMMIYGFKLLHMKNELSGIEIINVCCCFQLLHAELIVCH